VKALKFSEGAYLTNVSFNHAITPLRVIAARLLEAEPAPRLVEGFDPGNRSTVTSSDQRSTCPDGSLPRAMIAMAGANRQEATTRHNPREMVSHKTISVELNNYNSLLTETLTANN
jgi:hypothetical protein